MFNLLSTIFLITAVKQLTNLVNKLTLNQTSAPQPAQVPVVKAPAAAAAPSKPAPKPAAADDDDDIDLFGSDDEDNKEADELREKRLAEYAQKKAKSIYINLNC